MLATYVDSRAQFHRVDLVANTYATNPLWIERQHQVMAGLMAKGYAAATAQQASYGIMDQLLMRQAQMLSYNDAWKLILICFLCTIPAILILKKQRGPGMMAEAH